MHASPLVLSLIEFGISSLYLDCRVFSATCFLFLFFQVSFSDTVQKFSREGLGVT